MIGCDGEGTWRGRKTSIYIVRNHVKNGRLTVVEMISRNIKGVNGVETIAGATPTPVEMEKMSIDSIESAKRYTKKSLDFKRIEFYKKLRMLTENMDKK